MDSNYVLKPEEVSPPTSLGPISTNITGARFRRDLVDPRTVVVVVDAG